jgi:hypothetical protein
MKLNDGETRVTFFSRETSELTCIYDFCSSDILRTDCIKDLGVLLGCKLSIHQLVSYLFSDAIKLLGLTHITTFSPFFFSSRIVIH